jgi:diadenosine tetraphosphate (Ap4A) HIT family hydrolase
MLLQKTKNVSGTDSACPLCKAVNQVQDKCFIAKLQHGTLLLNWDQSYRGRCLYVINQHFTSIVEIDPKLFVACSEEMQTMAKIINDVFQPDLINVAMLGNHVRHLHWHIIPRYKGDPNWGDPPWPIEELKLTEPSYREIAAQILNAVEAQAEIHAPKKN